MGFFLGGGGAGGMEEARDFARQQINLPPSVYTLSEPIMHTGIKSGVYSPLNL